jgi:hypothetical protein
MLYANFVAVRMIMYYGLDAYFYDKLLVAYTVGGENGLKLELDRIPLTDKTPRETKLAKDFAVQLRSLTNPEVFLRDKVNKSREMVSCVRNLRTLAIAIMFILFGWQLIAKSMVKFKTKQSS